MTTNESFPKFDLPVDFIADDSITGDILNYYGNFPCKIKAGVFVLCTEGMVRATINLLEIVIRKNDFIVVLPNSFIQIHEVSSDTSLRSKRQPDNTGCSADRGFGCQLWNFFPVDLSMERTYSRLWRRKYDTDF